MNQGMTIGLGLLWLIQGLGMYGMPLSRRLSWLFSLLFDTGEPRYNESRYNESLLLRIFLGTVLNLYRIFVNSRYYELRYLEG